ncbi:hypothetical protein FSARC_221 [Fusarium sarcochroum]|uniref:Uncharacterized protein n=1 Tax=Fusarium sarcochroum TaxID=1208366 RepID=A0A8H4XFP9_9HYPO|nr:hypothetical protein FSARC_221 [Fusarium sarcochroum]
MLSLRSLFQITAFLAFHSQSSAQIVIGGETISADGSGNVGTKCPGILSITGNNNAGFCCVGGNLSTCKGWPICEATATAESVSCATKIPLSATDYTALIESASSKYLGSNSNGDAMPSSTADSTMATATSKTTSDEDGTDATSASSGQAKETGDSDNGARGLKAPLVAGIAGGVLALCFAL